MGSQADVKFQDKFVSPIHGCVMIVGQNPGKQRRGQQTNIVWEGNKSSDLLMSILEGLQGIYLTNVCNYQEMTDKRVEHGLKELRNKIEVLKPRLIACLGIFAHANVCGLDLEIPVDEFVHPSYVVRFNKDREVYKQAILEAIT